MTRILFLALLLIAVATSCGHGDSGPSAGSPIAGTSPGSGPNITAASANVSIPPGATGKGASAFGANPLVIPRGTTVTWINNDSMPHSATSSTGAWDSGTLNPGQSFSFTFNTPGDYAYFCTIHGAASMSGMVRVQ